MKNKDCEILEKMPKSYLLIREIWLKDKMPEASGKGVQNEIRQDS